MVHPRADLVHDGVDYDIEVDTAATSTADCAEAIRARARLGARARASRPVVIDYYPTWPIRPTTLVEVVGGLLGPLARPVEHIGSTAIPGMAAKDVIDLQVSVDDLEHAASVFDAPLATVDFLRSAIQRDHVPAGSPDAGPRRWEKRLWTRRGHLGGDVTVCTPAAALGCAR